MKKINLLKSIIVILIVVALLIMLIINIIRMNNSASENVLQYSKSEQFIFEDISEDLVKPQFSGLVLMKYKGSASQEDVIRAIYVMANDLIPRYYKMFNGKSESDIKKYYNVTANQEYAKRKLGITSYDCFSKLQYNIQQLKGETLKFKSYKFIKDSVEEVEEGVKAKLTILYENNKELQLEIFLKNNVKDNESILEVL